MLFNWPVWSKYIFQMCVGKTKDVLNGLNACPSASVSSCKKQRGDDEGAREVSTREGGQRKLWRGLKGKTRGGHTYCRSTPSVSVCVGDAEEGWERRASPPLLFLRKTNARKEMESSQGGWSPDVSLRCSAYKAQTPSVHSVILEIGRDQDES